MAIVKKQKEKPLTLSQLTDELSKYSHEILFPYMQENFIGEKNLTEFKNDVLTGQDKILKELQDLKQEKIVGDTQDKRKTKVLAIHNDALKRGKILSDQESLKIDQLGAF